jgi:hypothetical protein
MNKLEIGIFTRRHYTLFMQIDIISKIEIDQDGRLIIKPSQEKFPLIYRLAVEIH